MQPVYTTWKYTSTLRLGVKEASPHGIREALPMGRGLCPSGTSSPRGPFTKGTTSLPAWPFPFSPNTSAHVTAGENAHTLRDQHDNLLLNLKHALNTYRLLQEDPAKHRKCVQPHFHLSGLCDFCNGWKFKHMNRLTPPFWHVNIITPTTWASSLI